MKRKGEGHTMEIPSQPMRDMMRSQGGGEPLYVPREYSNSIPMEVEEEVTVAIAEGG